jgi:hypothetical protein
MNYDRIRRGRTLPPRPQLIALAMRKACARRRLSQSQLALQTGVALLSIQLVLKGRSEKTSFWTVARLAKALKLDLNYLAGLAPDQKGRPHGYYTIPD